MIPSCRYFLISVHTLEVVALQPCFVDYKVFLIHIMLAPLLVILVYYFLTGMWLSLSSPVVPVQKVSSPRWPEILLPPAYVGMGYRDSYYIMVALCS